MNSYEMTFIVRPDRDEDQTRQIVQTVTGRITSAGGEVIATAPWNPPRRRMAYPIKDFGDGFYVTTVFQLDGQALAAVENTLKLNENLLRFLVIRASETSIRQVQQRSQQAAAPSPAPAGAPAEAPEGQIAPESGQATTEAQVTAESAEVTQPAAESVEQPQPAVVEQADEGTTTEAVQSAASGAASTTQE